MAGFNGSGEICLRFKYPLAAGDVNERESIENAPLLPVKCESFWMAGGGISRMRRNPRFAGGGDVKPPISIATTDGKIAIK